MMWKMKANSCTVGRATNGENCGSLLVLELLLMFVVLFPFATRQFLTIVVL